jgi:ketosteroid isomerase-like protein
VAKEDVERALAGIEAWNRGDLEDLVARTHPDLEWVSSGAVPGLDPVYRGRDGFRTFWRDFQQAWESIRIEVDEVHDCGDKVVLLFTFEARGREGLEVRRRWGNVQEFRDGLLVRNQTCADWETARRAAGLPASGPAPIPDA